MSQVRILFDGWGPASDAARLGAEDAVTALAFMVQARAQRNITANGSVDTGAMRNSIYVHARGKSNRVQSIAAAVQAGAGPGAKSPKGHLVPIATPGTVIVGPLRAKVAVCVEYGIYVEMGTKYAGAKPYLAPAFAEVNKRAQKIAAQYVQDRLKGAIK